MIRLGLRLTLGGGKEAIARLVATAAGMALGVAMLLITLAGINAVNAQNGRFAWLQSGSMASSRTPVPGVDPVWWRVTGDRFHGRQIGYVEVAATGPNAPIPPGIPKLPGPGEFYASPAMAKLLRTTPAAQLRDRSPGLQIGTIERSALPSPDVLLVVAGRPADQLATEPRAHEVTRIATTPPSSCGDCEIGLGVNANGVDLVLVVAAGALIFPLLIFVGTASRLGAARREQRFAAIRLVGGTPHQISVMSAAESLLASLAGVALGFGLFFAIRAPLATVRFTGDPFFTSDLSLSLLQVAAVVTGVPLAAAVSARLAFRRVDITPLGITRRVTPKPPRAARMIPLLLGLAELTYFVVVGRPDTTPAQIRAYVPGFILVMAGLVFAGPWVTMIASRVLARRTRRPAGLIAGRRLSDDPRAGFRAVSGLVLALFVATVAIAIMTTITDNRGAAPAGASGKATLVMFLQGPDLTVEGHEVSPTTVSDIKSLEGVHAVGLVRAAQPLGVPPEPTLCPRNARGECSQPPSDVMACADLAQVPAFGRCPPSAEVVGIDTFEGDPTRVYRPAALTPPQLEALPVRLVAVVTNGTDATIERTRTALERLFPGFDNPVTLSEQSKDHTRTINQWTQVADVAILASLLIGGCSLAVSVAGGLVDRKRPFSLLRLSGAPLGVLRNVVVLESVVPMMLTAVVATAAGFAASQLFLRSQLDYTLDAPHAEYYLFVLLGLGASLAVIASTLPILRRITGPEVSRTE
jgi:hypothetical protein